MKNTVKRNIILSALLIIMLCVSLISGATYALFTSESEVNIAITSGKVKVEAIAQELKLYSQDKLQENETFENGGTATLEDGQITLVNITPGDKITFKIVIKNSSNVKVKYRTIITTIEDNGLFKGLNVTIDNKTYNGSIVKSKYQDLEIGSTDLIIDVAIELPLEAGDEYQEKTSKIVYKVEAVQGNADVSVSKAPIGATEVNDENELANALISDSITNIRLNANIVLSKKLEVSGTKVIYGEGKNIIGTDDYTSTLINVPTNSSLTIYNTIISGNNEWVWKEGQKEAIKMPLTDDEEEYDITKAVSSVGPELTTSLITSDGELILGEKSLIKNTYYVGKWGANPIIAINSGKLVIDGATIENNLGTIFNINNSNVIIEDCTIKNNFAYNANKGGIFALFNSTCTMNGGLITDNIGHVRSGFIFGVVNGSKLTINDGTITNNMMKNRGSSTGSVVCCENGGDFDMNGGSITNNRGILAGAISARWVFNGDNSNTIINLNGGNINGNTCIQSTWNNAEVFIRDTITTIGANMIIGGNVVLDSGTTLLTNNGTIDGDVIVQCNTATMTNNGIISGNVNVTDGIFLNNGTVNGTITLP